MNSKHPFSILQSIISVIIVHCILLYGIWAQQWSVGDVIIILWLELGLTAILESLLITKRLPQTSHLRLYYIVIFSFMFWQLGHQMYFVLTPLQGAPSYEMAILQAWQHGWWSITITLLSRFVQFVRQWRTATVLHTNLSPAQAQSTARSIGHSSWKIMYQILPMSVSMIFLISLPQYLPNLDIKVLLSIPIIFKGMFEIILKFRTQ